MTYLVFHIPVPIHWKPRFLRSRIMILKLQQQQQQQKEST